MERYLYIFLDIGALCIPLLFSFHSRIRLDRHWRALWPSILLVASVFIVWDVAFTRMGVWGFNPRYLIGIELFGIPIEEWLFFICIPYACVFTFYVFGSIAPDPWSVRTANVIAWAMIICLVLFGLFNANKWYTATTFFSLAVVMILLQVTRRTRFLGRFLLCYAVLLIPFFLINGALTGSFSDQPVVWYNDAENLNFRLWTIPVEDMFYGMLLILSNVVLFERWRTVDQ